MNRLHAAKAHLAAAVQKRVNTEEDRVGASLHARLDREETRAATALRKRLERERAREAAARKAAEHTSLPAAPSPPPSPSQEATTPAGMTQAQFWDLISETRRAAGNDTGAQSQLLETRLTHLSPQAILDFAWIRHTLDERAYTWDLWAAADVIEDGCSDDCFRDFRGYLISLGQGAYENALRNPDSLASVAEDREIGDWENADNVAPDAYSSVTGHDFPLDESDLSGEPRGTPFDDNDVAGLTARYPALAARFR